jgi:hypothetical protein
MQQHRRCGGFQILICGAGTSPRPRFQLCFRPSTSLSDAAAAVDVFLRFSSGVGELRSPLLLAGFCHNLCGWRFFSHLCGRCLFSRIPQQQLLASPLLPFLGNILGWFFFNLTLASSAG